MTDPAILTELHHLEERHGLLKVEDVVEAARAPTSPLHPHFTWDDTEAARLYRIDEARTLIRSAVEYVQVSPSRTIPVHVFCHLTTDNSGGGGYRSVVSVLKQPNLREQLLADALAELQHFQQKYEQYKELAQFKPLKGVFKEVEKLKDLQKVFAKKPPARIPLKGAAATHQQHA